MLLTGEDTKADVGKLGQRTVIEAPEGVLSICNVFYQFCFMITIFSVFYHYWGNMVRVVLMLVHLAFKVNA